MRFEIQAVPATAFLLMTIILMLVEIKPIEGQTTVGSFHLNETRIDEKLKKMNLKLPEISKPVGIYKRAVVVGKMVYLSGHIPIDEDGKILTGKLGDGVSIERGQVAAQRSGLAMLASLKAEIGSLDKIKRIVKTTGMVNCTSDFKDQPKVINGCSQLFKDLFGAENGVGARSAVGMNSLPRGAIVEIEAIFELK